MTKAMMMREVKDYLVITFGIICVSIAWSLFLLPYQITTGGTTGISAIIYYATGFPVQTSYFIINAVLMAFAWKILGPKFSIRTTYAVFTLTSLLWLFQLLVNNYLPLTADNIALSAEGKPLILGKGEDFMAAIIGAALCGTGLGIVFNANGSTGGTDIIAAIVHKYRDISLGRMVQVCDVFIILSCYFVFEDWRRVLFGFVVLLIIGFSLDYVINSSRQAVQFFIFSKEYEKIADRITKEASRGVTVVDGTGWYTQSDVKVLMVLTYKRQSVEIFRMIQDTDPNAFISQTAASAVFGNGFDKLKVKK